MNHSMTLQLPDDVVATLQQRADLTGVLPEDLAASWLSATVRRIASGPLLQLAGIIKDLPAEDDEPEIDDAPGSAGRADVTGGVRIGVGG